MSIVWKSSEILKVFGTTIREGVYVGGKLEGTDTVVKQEAPVQFTPSKIAKIYENITTHVPFYIGHDNSMTRKPVGFAYKFGVSENLDDIKYDGFVFDEEAKHKIIVEGYDKVSPEISGDEEHLLGIAFVKNPAINDTEVTMEPIVFSAPSTEQPAESAPPTEPPKETAPPREPPKETPREPRGDSVDIAKVLTQLEEYRSKYEETSAKMELMMTQQYDSIVAEMKGLGVSDPGSIVRGLPTEQKISVLTKMKENIVMNKPLATPPDTSPMSDKKTDVLDKVLSELGINKD